MRGEIWFSFSCNLANNRDLDFLWGYGFGVIFLCLNDLQLVLDFSKLLIDKVLNTNLLGWTSDEVILRIDL